MEEHTILESIVDRKNHYQGRMAENMVNIIYFTKRAEMLKAERDTMKVDTEERAAKNVEIAQAERQIKNGHENVEQDQMLIDSFDELIAQHKKETK